jgi:hypothetical protein
MTDVNLISPSDGPFDKGGIRHWLRLSPMCAVLPVFGVYLAMTGGSESAGLVWD